MRKRLRKKKHLGEFKQMGFSFRLLFDPPLEDDEYWGLFRKFGKWLFGRGFVFGGSFGSTEWGGHIDPYSNNSATEQDRQAVREWWEAQDQPPQTGVGGLQDANYDLDPIKVYRRTGKKLWK